MSILFSILTIEKTLQHLLTAAFFVVDIPGIGIPDIGGRFSVGDWSMAGLNLLYAVFFGLGLLGKTMKTRWGVPLVAALAALDIALEFVFHGLFYITVSVVVSFVLVFLSVKHLVRRREGDRRVQAERDGQHRRSGREATR